MNIARLRRSKAFTLIELIVVIVIMGILVAIGAFAYNAIIKSAKANAANKTAVQVAKTIQADSATNQVTYASLAGTLPSLVADDNSAGQFTVTEDAAYATTGLVTVANVDSGCSATITFTPASVGTADYTVSNGTCP